MKKYLYGFFIIAIVAMTAVIVNAAQTTPPGGPVPNSWYRAGNVTFGRHLFLTDISTALTAHAGGGQTSALALTSEVNEVTTVASGNDSVALPTVTYPGRMIYITNSAATNSMKIFGVSPATVNGIATATGYTLAAGKSTVCVSVSTTNWACVGP